MSAGENTLISDLAAAPGGVDKSAAERTGAKVITALSLPGRVAPESAGESIAETAVNILFQEGIIQ